MPLTRMQQRRGTAAQWQTDNPVLSAGELGYATDTRVVKIGDGVTAWNSLQSIANSGTLQLTSVSGNGARVWSGAGAPSTPGGAITYVSGDLYFRTGTPNTANQRIYIVTVGGTNPTWTGIV